MFFTSMFKTWLLYWAPNSFFASFQKLFIQLQGYDLEYSHIASPDFTQSFLHSYKTCFSWKIFAGLCILGGQ